MELQRAVGEGVVVEQAVVEEDVVEGAVVEEAAVEDVGEVVGAEYWYDLER